LFHKYVQLIKTFAFLRCYFRYLCRWTWQEQSDAHTKKKEFSVDVSLDIPNASLQRKHTESEERQSPRRKEHTESDLQHVDQEQVKVQV